MIMSITSKRQRRQRFSDKARRQTFVCLSAASRAVPSWLQCAAVKHVDLILVHAVRHGRRTARQKIRRGQHDRTVSCGPSAPTVTAAWYSRLKGIKFRGGLFRPCLKSVMVSFLFFCRPKKEI